MTHPRPNPNPDPARLPHKLLLPQFWPTWLGLGLLWLLGQLPYQTGVALGESVGALACKIAARRRHIVRVNLRRCLPEHSAAQIEDLVEAHFRALGRALYESALAWFGSDEQLRGLGEVRGLVHLDAVQKTGQGALLLTGHFTHLEIGARLLGIHRPFHAMYRPANNAVVDWCVARWREQRSGRPSLPKDDLKRLVRGLRAGGAVWYAPDQVLRQPNAVFLPMFGQPTLALTATSRLAEMGRARVVPFFTRRERGRYIVEIQPALEAFPTADDRADAARVLGLIEGAARRSLPEYFWIHRRFKERPPEMPDPYAGT